MMDELRARLHAYLEQGHTVWSIVKETGIPHACLYRFKQKGGLNGTHTLKLMQHLGVKMEEICID